MKGLKTDATLDVQTDMKFLPLVLSFAESSSRIFGLDDKDALKLTLASEEIFAYLCRMTKDPKPLTLTMMNGVYYALLKFIFEGIDFDPRAFNLTADMSLDEEGLEEMGLLIASRSVERMSLFHNAMEGTGFTLIKEKTYPEDGPSAGEEAPTLDGLSFRKPDPDDLRAFSRSITTHYSASLYPQDFRYPGKIVDMVESSEYDGLVVSDSKGRIAGGIIWRCSGTKMIECYGPYLFLETKKAGMVQELVDGFISDVARSDAVCIINRYATDDLPHGYFEKLGTIDFVRGDVGRAPWPFFFRQLKEDLGCRVYAHAGIEEFLKGEYRRHFLAREIVSVRYEGERRNPHSVFGANFQRSHRLVVLNPLWDGADTQENLRKHVHLLRSEGIVNILVEIDLGHSWQARLYPVIEANGFEPALVIPYGGKADLVIFCLRG